MLFHFLTTIKFLPKRERRKPKKRQLKIPRMPARTMPRRTACYICGHYFRRLHLYAEVDCSLPREFVTGEPQREVHKILVCAACHSELLNRKEKAA